MEQTPLERAARALRDINSPEGEWEPWLDDARAVLLAIREPTKAMIDAGWNTGNPEEGWQAMLDTALKDE